MESSKQNILVIFGLKKEYDVFLETRNVEKIYGFGEKSLINLKKVNLSEIKTIVNIGYCGSIDPDVKCGEIVRIKNIINEDGKKIKCANDNDKTISKRIEKLNLKELNLITTLNVKNLKEKKKLKKKYSDVSIIDMEAFHLVQKLKKGISFYSIKIVYDDLSFEIPSVFQDYLNNDGELILKKDLLITLFKNPELLIGLINMGQKYFFCKRRLRYLLKKIFPR